MPALSALLFVEHCARPFFSLLGFFAALLCKGAKAIEPTEREGPKVALKTAKKSLARVLLIIFFRWRKIYD